jgi:hypothetical protein
MRRHGADSAASSQEGAQSVGADDVMRVHTFKGRPRIAEAFGEQPIYAGPGVLKDMIVDEERLSF